MRFEASPGHIILRLYKEQKGSKLIMPENVQLDEYPTFEIVSVGAGRVWDTGNQEKIPYNVGDRVVVAAGRCMPLKNNDETLYIVDWKLIFAQAFTDNE